MDKNFKFTDGDIHDVNITHPEEFIDGRGWLVELARGEPSGEHIAMAYASLTEPAVVRGPHQHEYQTDRFVFLSGSVFRIWLWDSRADSPTFGKRMRLDTGAAPWHIVVPARVVHAYRNDGDTPGIVFNLPDRQYRGESGNCDVDEIRWEDDPDSPYLLF